MSEPKLLFIYFILGLIFGGVSGALYIVSLVKYRKIQPEMLRYLFEKLIILWIIIGFVIVLATSVLR